MNYGISLQKQNFVNVNRTRVKTNYEEVSVIGKGAFGVVKKVIHKLTSQERAIKAIKYVEEKEEALTNEISILKELDHPNVIKLFEFFQERDKYYLVYELLKGGELFEKVKIQKFLSE